MVGQIGAVFTFKEYDVKEYRAKDKTSARGLQFFKKGENELSNYVALYSGNVHGGKDDHTEKFYKGIAKDILDAKAKNGDVWADEVEIEMTGSGKQHWVTWTKYWPVDGSDKAEQFNIWNNTF